MVAAKKTYGALNITAEEKTKRARSVAAAVNSARLDGQELGRHVLAVYEEYLAGDITQEEMLQKNKAAAIQDLKEYQFQLDARYPS
ncbi:hypothetical protein L1281_001712 [Neisseria sp. HSC-16F19]|nr:antitoxin VbhA family protein [Neisseria sp. HSC-16F19]MCP2041118.1 hypothetical protein [Neisseria sp. HSC-16F19]